MTMGTTMEILNFTQITKVEASKTLRTRKKQIGDNTVQELNIIKLLKYI